MKVEMVRPEELDREQAARWEAIREPTMRSRARSTVSSSHRVVSRLRPVELAVIEVDQQIAGFWAFERRGLGLAVPIAQPFSDHHGPIVAPDLELSTSRLLKGSRRQMFWFDGVPAEQRLFRRFHRSVRESPIVRLDGLRPSNQRRKWTRLGREVGEVRFEVNCDDSRVLDRLIDWKRRHSARTQVNDPFADPWGRSLLHELHRTQTPELRGWLSVLWAGDVPVAAHFGIVSPRAWHWWIPSYDTAYARHSPGTIMLHEMLKAACERGIEWLDFGPGPEEFKNRLANDAFPLALGTASTPAAGVALGVKRGVEDVARRTPAPGHAATSRRMVREARATEFYVALKP